MTSRTTPSTSSPRTTWISRVPDTISEAKKLKDLVDDNKFEKLENGYSIYETTSKYGGVNQRWFLVFSQQALHRASETIDRNVVSEYKKLEEKLKKLSSQKFSCCEDARKAFDKFNVSKYHKIELIKIIEQKAFLKRGKPKKSDPFKLEYCIEAKMTEDTDKIMKTKKYQACYHQHARLPSNLKNFCGGGSISEKPG